MNGVMPDINEQANSEPLVTIGLPIYNRAAGLKKCLEYLSLQTYRNLEILISDNCSTDNAVQEVIQAFAAKDKRVKAIRQTVNIGMEANFNYVFAQASADYFMWMSDDDYFDANYVSACMKLLLASPDHVLCSGVAKYYNDDQFLFTEKMFAVDQTRPFDRLRTYFSKVDKNGNFYGIFRNRLLLEDPISAHIGCDWSLMAKLAILGKLTYVDTTSYHRSAEGNSETRKKMISKFGFNRFQAAFFETYSAYLIASNIFNDHTVSNKFNYLQKKLIVTMIFFQINFKLLTKFIKKKLGFKQDQ